MTTKTRDTRQAGGGWRSWGVRQLTGTPWVYHAYVGRAGPERTCCAVNHRSDIRAARCAERAAKRLNRATIAATGEMP